LTVAKTGAILKSIGTLLLLVRPWMNKTKHFQQRMSQRGVTRTIVDLVLAFGNVEQNKHVLDRKHAIGLLELLKREERALMKIVDKGGVAVVALGSSLVTTYNLADGDR
jgi:hypothetical protein